MTGKPEAIELASDYISRSRLDMSSRPRTGAPHVSEELTVTYPTGGTATIPEDARLVLRAEGLLPDKLDWSDERNFAEAMFVLGAAIGVAQERRGMIQEVAPQIHELAERALGASEVTRG